ncbi:uncharacterized protein LOC135932533 [Pelmatolapia mariae]|uniref:uncharacterized protein LOC135932480 n=1 Tax=Pelmatolapia mariae TaxID=158779 RepID=UPI003211CB83
MQHGQPQPNTSRNFRCPGPGVFQCTLTGLMFDVSQGAELLYRTAQWDERLLQQASKIAAGPLFNIESSEDAIHQLHLPHCIPKHALHSNGLSVVHISDGEMEILKPLNIIDTHVIVEVTHLSSFGLVWPLDMLMSLWHQEKTILGQVLLFLRPPNPRTQTQNINVFLLPRNIPVKEEKKFHPDFGPNYHPTFEVRLPANTEEVLITVQDQAQTEVWRWDTDLTDVQSRDNQPRLQSLPADKRLFSVRIQFVEKVSDSTLNQLLDRLLQEEIITMEEMEAARIKPRAERARDVIDVVRNKGERASSFLIDALCELDKHLFGSLGLS